MTERSAKALIGAFVLGAVALLVVITVLLGSGALDNRNPTYALFFNTSLKGLVQGSPVYFKGIRVGKVKSIQILPAQEENSFKTPVIIEIEKKKANSLFEEEEKELFDDSGLIARMIDRGLRARLGISSVLTGQLCVELDIFPNAEHIDPHALMPFRDSPQIPTQLSSLDSAMAALENIPLQEVLMDIVRGITHLGDQIDKLDISRLVSSLTATSDAAHVQIDQFTSVRKSLESALASLETLAKSAQNNLQSTSEQVSKTMNSYDTLAHSLQKDLHGTASQAMSAISGAGTLINSADALLRDARNGLKEAENALADIRKTSRSARSLFSEDSAPVLEFSRTLLAIRKAAQALSDLAVLLDVKPNSLIFGRNKQ